MRLLDTKTLKLCEVRSDIPHYAILSHTWAEGEEVTIAEIGTPEAEKKLGLQKIKRCCEQAVSDGFKYVWIDTCCIDKQSSSELSEAINSMYLWYKNAQVCYAYLADVTDDGGHPGPDFAESRWFTRGWTLQELVAPSNVVFFGKCWGKIGTKASLRDDLSNITTIDTHVLEHSQAVFKATVAQRMSWASKRQTTRVEDIAYCLLGIFNVHMPLLYGEGEKAFMRLQLELLNASNEQTIFAWSLPTEVGEEVSTPPRHVKRQNSGAVDLTIELLAPSPALFSECGDVRQFDGTLPHHMTNVGLSITLPTLRVAESKPRVPLFRLVRPSNVHLAILNCYRECPDNPEKHLKLICISLWDEGHSRFHRLRYGEEVTEPQERNWARMTPMFITPVHSHHRGGGAHFWVDGGDISLRDRLRHGSSLPSLPAWMDERRLVHWSAYTLLRAGEVLASSFIHVLLLFVPLGIVAGAMHWDPMTVFVLNYLAIIPLARLLSFATKALSAKLEQTLGGLMDATFGNAVLVVSIVALNNGHIRVVQSSMLGSILSNILLVLGCCFLAGGIRHNKQSFNSTSASTMSSLMAVALASLIIPATLYAILHTSELDSAKHILFLSRGAAIILLIVYCLYLYFQLRFHANFLDIEQGEGEDTEESSEGQVLGPIAAGVALLLVTFIMTLCAAYFVDSIDPIAERGHFSKLFVGFILIPMVGSAADPATAVFIAYKDKIDLAINIAIRRSVQIALFVTPFMVILGWVIDQAMTLHFQGFETIVFFLSLLVVSYLVQDGKSKHLASAMCIGTYVIIALTFYVYPDDASSSGGSFLKDLFGPHPR